MLPVMEAWRALVNLYKRKKKSKANEKDVDWSTMVEDGVPIYCNELIICALKIDKNSLE